MITIRQTGGAIVGQGRDLSAIRRLHRWIGSKPTVTIRSDGFYGADCACVWPESGARCEVHFNVYGFAWKWFKRNARTIS